MGRLTRIFRLLLWSLEVLAHGDARGLWVVFSLWKASRPDERPGIRAIEVQRHDLSGSTVLVGDSVVGDEARTGVTIGELTLRGSKSPEWGRFLYWMVRRLKPDRCLELGTAVGISAAYIGRALDDGKKGLLDTIEKQPEAVRSARSMLDTLGLSDYVNVIAGEFSEVLDTLEGESQVRYDFVFVDGHKSGQALLRYLERLCELSNPSAVFIIDDIGWSEEMNLAWRELARSDQYRRAQSLGSVGVLLR